MSIEMTSRERLKTVFAHKMPDRVPMAEISIWPQAVENWRKEGLPEGVHPHDYFQMDCLDGFGIDGSLQLPTETLEETERWQIVRDANGVTVKTWREGYGDFAPPCRVDCTVKDWDSWLSVKDRLVPDPTRIDEERLKWYEYARSIDRFVFYNPGEPMWFLLEDLTGFEVGLPLLAEEPELAADILKTQTDFMLGMGDLLIEKGVEFDALWFFSDLCYKNGMLFSPNTYRELLMPQHRRIKDWCSANNMPLILHCCGDARKLVPMLVEVGFDAIQPLEARAGNDVREYKKQFGSDIVFFGNINTDVMADGTDEQLEEEIRTKVTVAKEGGGYIFHSDHSIPPTVSWERYKRVIELGRHYGKY